MARKWKIALGIVAALVLLVCGAVGYLWMQWRWTYEDVQTVRVKQPQPTAAEKKLSAAQMETKIRQMQEKLAALEPKGVNVVIDTGANRLYLRNGAQVLREAIVSCGSGNILPNPKGKEWVFDSPRGERTVQGKKTNPIWTKPDWAFVEEGKPIPKRRDDPERFEENVLGDYALTLGNGFMLHGTLYKRMLGRNVTHGCVRIGDEDLEALYKSVPVGSKVYFY